MIHLLLALSASAASLDNIEVGGPFGLPTSTDATAVFWNPAGMAVEPGTFVQLEGAPTLATIHFDRDDPYGHGGAGTLNLAGAVPFLGVHSDFGVKGLGLGATVAVPFVRGARENPEPGVSRYANRAGQIQAMVASAGVAWSPIPQLAVGATGGLLVSQWTARVDSETLSQLDEQIRDLGQESGYTDAMVEDPRYATTLQFGNLADVVPTFSAGLMVVPHERVRIGATYVHGARVDNTGDVRMAFNCPPQDDVLGRFGSEAYGLCYANLVADASVGYRLPSKIFGGITVEPIDDLEISAMGGFVGWKAYTDFEVVVSGVAERNEGVSAETAELLYKNRKWARDNQDSYWLGLDIKGEPTEALTLGGRVIWDKAAVPDRALSPNNYDANDLMLTGLAAVEPKEGFEISLSYTAHALATRTVESGFGVTLDEADQLEDRWFYPQMSGTYSGIIHRIGIGIRLEFGDHGDEEDAP